jgi:hypothetical protein
MKKNLAIAILATITILLAVTVYAQATEIPVRIMFERTVTWPIIWRIAGEMEGVSTAGMTGPDKIHLVSVWATKIVREHAGQYLIEQAQVAAHAAGQAQAGAVVATPGD